MDGLPASATSMAPACVMAEWYRARARDLLTANAELVLRLHQQSSVITRQADRIDLLETLLAANGPRAMARLRRSGWWRRLLRRLGGA